VSGLILVLLSKQMSAQKTRGSSVNITSDAGHFALDTAADEIAAPVRGLVGS
jgi:hypothetical protein